MSTQEVGHSDDAIDAGVRAFFAVRDVRAGEHFMRRRIRAAVAAVLDASERDQARRTMLLPVRSSQTPRHRPGRT